MIRIFLEPFCLQNQMLIKRITENDKIYINAADRIQNVSVINYTSRHISRIIIGFPKVSLNLNRNSNTYIIDCGELTFDIDTARCASNIHEPSRYVLIPGISMFSACLYSIAKREANQSVIQLTKNKY